MDFLEAKGILNGRSHKELNHNTFLHPVNGTFAISYYKKDFIVYKKDGSMIIDPKGSRSTTIKSRINDYLPKNFLIFQKDGVWFWNIGKEFKDGDKIKNGKIIRSYGKK